MANSPESALRQKTIFVSRSREESAELCGELESRGARVISSRLLRFALPEDLVPLDSAMKMLGEFDWWLITSQHAVEFAVVRSQSLDTNLRELARGVRVGVVGAATAEAARSAGLQIAHVAAQQSASSLAEELAAQISGKRVLLLRSNLADSALPLSLSGRGAQVADVIGYRTLPPDQQEKTHLASIPWRSIDAAVFFSPSAIRHLADAIGAEKMKELAARGIPVAVGATTAQELLRHGFERCVQAEQTTFRAIVAALEECFSPRQSHKMTGAQRG